MSYSIEIEIECGSDELQVTIFKDAPAGETRPMMFAGPLSALVDAIRFEMGVRNLALKISESPALVEEVRRFVLQVGESPVLAEEVRRWMADAG